MNAERRPAVGNEVNGAGALLRLAGVSRHFGSLRAVQDVSFGMNEGELRAVIGPNGAGKTTFFNCLLGIIRPDTGRVSFDGRDLSRVPTHR